MEIALLLELKSDWFEPPKGMTVGLASVGNGYTWSVFGLFVTRIIARWQLNLYCRHFHVDVMTVRAWTER